MNCSCVIIRAEDEEDEPCLKKSKSAEDGGVLQMTNSKRLHCTKDSDENSTCDTLSLKQNFLKHS